MHFHSLSSWGSCDSCFFSSSKLKELQLCSSWRTSSPGDKALTTHTISIFRQTQLDVTDMHNPTELIVTHTETHTRVKPQSIPRFWGDRLFEEVLCRSFQFSATGRTFQFSLSLTTIKLKILIFYSWRNSVYIVFSTIWAFMFNLTFQVSLTLTFSTPDVIIQTVWLTWK